MSAQEQHQSFLMLQIKALQIENERLNNELKKVKEVAFKIRLSDPKFDKPLSDLEVNYEIVKPCQIPT
jgi:K+/H+ antiporter YhaU regulatory subunit KhtT